MTRREWIVELLFWLAYVGMVGACMLAIALAGPSSCCRDTPHAPPPLDSDSVMPWR